MAEQMVERVAKALRADRYPDDPWETASELCREDFRGHARAAIEAMREPTEAMVQATPRSMSEGTTREAWGAMIDAALAPRAQGDKPT